MEEWAAWVAWAVWEDSTELEYLRWEQEAQECNFSQRTLTEEAGTTLEQDFLDSHFKDFQDFLDSSRNLNAENDFLIDLFYVILDSNSVAL